MQKSRKGTAPQRDWKCLFAMLAEGAKLEAKPNETDLNLVGQTSTLSVTVAELSDLVRRGLIRRQGSIVSLTQMGENLVPRSSTRSISVTREGSDSNFCVRNDDESPLASLRRHKDWQGKPFLDDAQFDAGERLRADFTRGQLTPRVTANWQASVSSGRRSGPSGAVEDLAHAALSARQRFESAVESMSHDLSGVLIDFCCFLKGLEQVETERRWPRVQTL